MPTHTKTLTTLILVLAVSIASWIYTDRSSFQSSSTRILQSYQTSSSRMKINQMYCQGVDRTNFINSADISLKQQYLSHFNISFQVDGNVFINSLMDNWSQAPQKFQEQTSGFVMFAGPFAIALILLLISAPFLGSCCCCPNCCPPSCCRQPEDQLYSSCQLKCPAAFAIFAFMAAISGAAYGFISAESINSTLKTMTCSLAVVPDDFLNGNTTANNASFFTGLNVLSTSLNHFSGNLTQINTILTQFNSNNSNMTTANTDGNILMNNIKDTDGTTGNGMTTLTYGAPISQSSQFPGILGTYNTSGLIYSYYTLVSTIVSNLNTLSTNVDTYFNSSATISTTITSIQSNLSSLISTVNELDNTANNYPDGPTYLESTSLYIKVFYSVMVGLSLFGILGAMLMCCCQKYKCRYLMYFSCFLLSIVAIVGLLLTTVVSFILPPMQWGCQFLATSMQNRYQFSRNFRGLSSQNQNYISTCMPYGDGNIINQLSPNLNSLNNLTSAFSFLQTVNFATLNSSITTGKDTYLNTVNSYGSSQISDVSSSADSTLSSYASASNFASCGDANFALDSYVPSNNQNPTYVSCTTSGNNAGSTECSGNFNPKGGSCFGCLDVADIFSSYANGAAVTSDIQGRYGNAIGCITFATDIGLLWTNFYDRKQVTIGSTYKPANGIYNSINNLDIATFQSDLSTLDGALAGVNASINSLNSLLDTKYGMLGGMNCKLFGEDFANIIDTTCVQGWNALFKIRLALGICCLGIFFATFCVVCSGSRYARQSQKRDKKFENDEERENAEKYQQNKQQMPKRPQNYMNQNTLQSFRRH